MVTIADIAARVGVSHGVVSCVLNNRLGKIRVNEAKRLLILDVAAEMGYVPNRSAKTLATRHNQALGLVITYARNGQLTADAGASIFSILNGMHKAADPQGYRCLYGFADMKSSSAFEVPEFIRERSVDGVVLFGYVNRSVEQELKKFGVPILHIGSNVDAGSALRSVYADMESAACDVLDRAASAGLKSVNLFLPSGPGPLKIARAFEAHAAARYPHLTATVCFAAGSDCSFEEAREYGARIGRKNPPELIITSISESNGLISGLMRAGLRCPEDIELVCFSPEGYQDHRLGPDDIHTTQYVIPFTEISRLVTTRLLSEIKQGEGTEDLIIPCQFASGGTAPSIERQEGRREGVRG